MGVNSLPKTVTRVADSAPRRRKADRAGTSATDVRDVFLRVSQQRLVDWHGY